MRQLRIEGLSIRVQSLREFSDPVEEARSILAVINEILGDGGFSDDPVVLVPLIILATYENEEV